MKRIEIELSVAEHLAFDDALIDAADRNPDASESLRFWMADRPAVVIGRSSPLAREVQMGFCRENHIPVYRRITGGQSVVILPGCLMYSVLLSYRLRPELRMIDQAHRFVIGQNRQALAAIGVDCELSGTSDLTIDGRKFSGNSLRCKRHWMLYHGTFLIDADLAIISQCLKSPVRQPDYRSQRSHADFLTQIKTSAASMRTALQTVWDARELQSDLPLAATKRLAVEKYASADWLHRVP